mgnify:CR=1 FL=1
MSLIGRFGDSIPVTVAGDGSWTEKPCLEVGHVWSRDAYDQLHRTYDFYSVHSLRSVFDDRPYRCQKRGLEMDWSPLVSLDR